MADEENIVEIEETKKKPINVWKIALISLVSIGIFIALCINIYNSDWYINQTLHIKKATDIPLGKNVTWSYNNKYEGNLLKINLTLKNIDDKVMKIADKYLKEDEDLLFLVFVDKDGFKLTELKISKNELIHTSDIDGQYMAQCSLMLDKKVVRKIRDIDPKYRAILDMKYDDMLKEIDSRYRKAISNLFGF